MKFLMMALVIIGGSTVGAASEQFLIPKSDDQYPSCKQGKVVHTSSSTDCFEESQGLTYHSTPQPSGKNTPHQPSERGSYLIEGSSQCTTPLRGVSLPPSSVGMASSLKKSKSTDCFEKSLWIPCLLTHQTSGGRPSLNESISQSTHPFVGGCLPFSALKVSQTDCFEESTGLTRLPTPQASERWPSLNEGSASSSQSKSDSIVYTQEAQPCRPIFSETTYNLLMRGVISTDDGEKVVQSKGDWTPFLDYIQNITPSFWEKMEELYQALTYHREDAVKDFIADCLFVNPTLRLTSEKANIILDTVLLDLYYISKKDSSMGAKLNSSSINPDITQHFSKTTYDVLVRRVIRTGSLEKVVQSKGDWTPFLDRIQSIPTASLEDIENISFDVDWRRVITIEKFKADCNLANPTLRLTSEKAEELLKTIGKDLRAILSEKAYY